MTLKLKDRFPEAVSPSEWGARVNYDLKVWTPWNEDKWILHWGGTPASSGAAQGNPADERAQLRVWENFHLDVQGWRGIAYNWAIGNSGTLYRLRGDNASAATAGDEEPDGIKENNEAIAVVFIVGQGQVVSDAALNTFRRMYGRVPELTKVTGHKFVAEGPGYGTITTCPGPQLSTFITEQDYLGGAMSQLLAYTPGDDPEAIKRLQQMLVQFFDADLGPTGIDGVWGPILTTELDELLPGDDNTGNLNPFQVIRLVRLAVDRRIAAALPSLSEHGNELHKTNFAKAGHKHQALLDTVAALAGQITTLNDEVAAAKARLQKLEAFEQEVREL